jgi:LysR family transcriptional regulator, regulator for bpeEF and oprC
MIDYLSDFVIFEKVATLQSFSKAARVLELPKSSVSRSVARLEERLGTRLLQRTTRRAVVTEAGTLLRTHCAGLLERIDEAVNLVSVYAAAPRGQLRISAGVGFAIHVLGPLLPKFTERHPQIELSLRLGFHSLDLVADGIDVAVHVGQLADSGLIASRLGAMGRYLCASPAYLKRRGHPQTIEDLRDHDRIETPGDYGRQRSWIFFDEAGRKCELDAKPRIIVNESATIHKLIVNGGGIGVLSGFICNEDFRDGRLQRILPQWSMPPLDVSVVHPSSRTLSPAVRAFIDFLKTSPDLAKLWLQPRSEGRGDFSREKGNVAGSTA